DATRGGDCGGVDDDVVRNLAGQEEARLGSDGAAVERGNLFVTTPIDVQAGTELANLAVPDAIDHDAEGSLVVLLDEQHDGAVKVRVEQVRHGDDQRRGGELVHARTLARSESKVQRRF